MPDTPVIPEFITVHLGRPDQAAENVTVSFSDYLKNVASSEIYPTWPQEALRANIYAQSNFALNRIYLEYYPSRGYDFDITNSTAYDQSFVNGRDFFETVSNIVDEQFTNYIVRDGQIEPLFTAYCDGVEVWCPGLKQVETVTLAERGYSAEDILRYYYGDDITFITNAPVQNISPSYPGAPLRPGLANNEVQQLQVRLNRISRNYPGIPKIYPVNGAYGQSTENAVRTFQQVFDLPVTGIVDKSTWYRIAQIYAGVKRLSELDSEGLTQEDIPRQYPGVQRPGDTGRRVRQLQYFIAVLGEFYTSIRPISISGTYDQQTENAVRDIQQTFGLSVDGIVGQQTWQSIYSAYLGIIDTQRGIEGGIARYPGQVLAVGSTGDDVLLIQSYLQLIAQYFSNVPSITPDGIFGSQTEAAVRAVQQLYALEETGAIDPLTWDAIASLYSDLTVGGDKIGGQFPYEIS